MPSSRILIASNTLSTSAASVTFSSIPSTYTDLVLRASIRATASTSLVDVIFNNTSTSYSSTAVIGGGDFTESSRKTNATETQISAVSSAFTSSTFSSVELYIPNYAGSTNKVFSHFGVTENNATSAQVRAFAGLWSNTSAINEIKISYTNLASGSSFFLYGLKNS